MDRPFEILQEILEAYKQKTYAELDALPATLDIHDARLPESTDVIRMRKTRHSDGRLKIELCLQQCIPRTGPISIIMKFLANMKILKIFAGFTEYFDILPDGTLIEDEFTRSMKAEEETLEQADWIGTTGLGEEAERELPKYLRLEYGESILDEDSLKASDLEYLGVFALDAKDIRDGDFSDDAIRVHFWKIPCSDDEPMYGYIEECSDDICYGMGDYLPKRKP